MATKNCRIRSIHQNPDSLKKCYEFWLMSTFELTFLGIHSFDSVYSYLNRKLLTWSGEFSWKRLLRMLHQNPDSRSFPTISKTLIQLQIQTQFSTQLQASFSTWAFNRSLSTCTSRLVWKLFHFEACIRILTVRKIQKLLIILTCFDIRTYNCA